MRALQATRLSLLVACVAVSACSKTREPAPAPAAVASAQAPEPATVGSLGVSKPAPERVVAIGDLHGDLDATRRALRLAGAIDKNDKWIGGKLVVVQTGDTIDRGNDDRKILDLVERLKGEASTAGGQLLALVGNHEIMNDQLDFRYVTSGAFAEFADVTPKDESIAQALTKLERPTRGRAAAFLPRGPYAEMLANRPVVARVGDSIFVHGGVLSKHVTEDGGLDGINSGTAQWLRGEKASPPKAILADDGPLWTRMYSADPGPKECAELQETLRLLHAKRMVMGHTVQKPDISPACNDMAVRIDVGMSKYYGGPIEVLELRGDIVRTLKEGD